MSLWVPLGAVIAALIFLVGALDTAFAVKAQTTENSQDITDLKEFVVDTNKEMRKGSVRMERMETKLDFIIEKVK